MKNSVTLLGREAEASFDKSPLDWLDRMADDGVGARWIAPGRLCIADAIVARGVLRNQEKLYLDETDFFGTAAGVFGPREAQIAMAQEARARLEALMAASPVEKLVHDLGASSRWPRAGVELMWRYARASLLRDDRSPRLRAAVEKVVEARILRRGEPTGGPLGRISRRFEFFAAFSEARARQPARDGDRRDMLDIVFAHAAAAPEEQLIELYSSFLFAVVSSIGLTLGWTLMLAAEAGALGQEPTHLVSEASRLFPVAWLQERRPARPHMILGESVTPKDVVVISPYAVHRSRSNWPQPTEFRPERWASTPDRSAWIPFGAGAHGCVAVALTFEIIGAILRELSHAYAAEVRVVGATPGLGVSLAPPEFHLTLTARAA